MLFKVLYLFLCFQMILTKSIQNDSEDINNRVGVLEESITTLQKRVENITDIMERGVLKTTKNRVMFYARLSSTKTLHFHSTIKFNIVVTNEGGHYNPGDGVFVAPVSGAYLFSWTALTYGSNYEFTELRVENVVRASVVSSGATSQYSPGTTTLVCHVDKGDHVWVETSGGSPKNYLYDWGEDTTSFMGLLIYEDDE